ncbi:hypothetical protein TrLO_g15413 [Triparma laevis f. longispina]|uniref:Dienelactone hydrolase domain-containing protein n=1 Tax=Triparma laevis f. longispina TaxID=1714387 RepID=A0A9W7EAA9_9STRA|nr:hypothetical protein TrLO_g15413 [Triparma laevis f. longispina]
MSCCPPDAHPYAQPPEGYSPRGVEKTLGSDLKVYVSSPPSSPTAAILVLPEVFGWSGRLKGICDSFASYGYLAIMPDCHRGDTALGKPDIPKWVAEVDYDVVGKDLEDIRSYLSSLEITSISSIGFCWGAWAWAKAASSNFNFKCCIGPHPSIKLEHFAFNRSIVEMCEKITCPVLLIPGSNDQDEVKPGGEFAAIFEAKGGKSVLFEDQLHGWMSRGDVNDPEIKAGVEKGMELALEFLKEHST